MTRNPYYRKAVKAWYILWHGRQVRLGRTKREADRAWRKLLSGESPSSSHRVSEIVAQFITWTEENRAADTVVFYRKYLNSFTARYGKSQVESLRPYHVSEWLKFHGYTGTTGNCAVRAVMRAFNWSVRQGLLASNPLVGVERPPATPREAYITREQWTAVLSQVQEGDPFRDLLLMLWETGCRPQEARTLESRHFDPVARTVTFPRAESKGKRRQRVIVLNAVALGIVSRLAAKYPTGPLFRNTDGNPWCAYSINCRFRRLKAKLGFSIFAYAIRHTWATNALLAGVEPLTVATLMGHTSINMIWSTYQKLQLQSDHMRAAAEQATRPRTPPTNPPAELQDGDSAQPE
ncbi:MAG: tyrosine-type recombinase/integrase [Planctomycetaceae bacterium]|nr:tyrosine-type recombinase/integrase [Planctomycetaceae bacterium]